MAKRNFVWMDLEMTGLDPRKDTILEIAVIITDTYLNVINNGIDIVINHSQEILDNMNDWCKEHHAKSGLIEAVKNSNISLNEAKNIIMTLIQEYSDPNCSFLCGNSIGQDKAFLYQHMPEITDFLHYRIIDVSTIKELVRSWYGDEYVYKNKASNHRALDDIKGSIEELKFYKDKVFKTDII